MLNEKERISIKPAIVFREEDEGAFLFDPDTGRIYYLNEVGMTIWKICKKPISQKQIISEICSEYPEVSEEKISCDFINFINDLEGLGFLSFER